MTDAARAQALVGSGNHVYRVVEGWARWPHDWSLHASGAGYLPNRPCASCWSSV